MLRFTFLALSLLIAGPLQAQQQANDTEVRKERLKKILKVGEGPEHTVVEDRFKADKEALANPYVINQHRQNYLMPISYQTNPNQFTGEDITSGEIDHMESKFQVSVSMPLFLEERDNHPVADGLYFAFTAKSNWQVYNSEISKPFRETNYEPEIFYTFSEDISLLGYQFNLAQLGFSHQSNGQNQISSRSWNRLYGSLLFSDETSFYYLKAWYRIPEDDKEGPLDPTGDDNPDITHYMGHFEFAYGTRLDHITEDLKLMALVRNNLKSSDNKGAIELNLSYPLSERYEVVFQYFNGYGDSLIDYNRHQQRFSLGIQLAYF